MKSKTMRHLFCRSAFAACLMGTAVMLPSCEDQNLTGQPSWLGNSIYERLQEEGNYTTTLKLIDDLKLTEVLSHTGSKTLFVADDAAFEEWFRTNDWGVTNYDQLSDAQKKLLLNSSMINNAYLVELLSNVSGNPPQSGMCMRRATSLSVYDSVYIMKPADMPAGEVWDQYRDRPEGIVLLKDATTPPMIHFLPKFMEFYDFTEQDLSLLTNGAATSLGEAWVNGKQVFERDITCKNGYIHKVNGVLTPNDNMAEIIRKQGRGGDDDAEGTSLWSKFIDRFAAPYYAGNSITNEYRRLYGTQDSVYVLRYLSNQSSNGKNNTTPDGETAPVVLPFDPGWNQYMYSNTMNYDMHYDAAMMIVPTNKAVQDWFEYGAGNALKQEFDSLEGIPNQTLIELLNVNMIDALTGKVPSKFADILDPSTQESLGITPEDIVASHMGCNGVVFVVDKVFSPYSYSSVVFPAMVRERTFKTIYWGIDYEPTSDDSEPTLYFKPFLNSKLSHYSLLLPDNQAMMQYLDPVYYGTGGSQSLLEFSYDSLKSTLQAKRITCTVDANGEIKKTIGVGAGLDVSAAVMKNRMRDMIENMIIVGEFKEGQEYYKTKSGSYVRVQNPGVEGMMTIQGAWQMQHGGKALKVSKIYHQDNGEAYQLEGQMPLTSTKSLYMTLKEQPQYKQFFDLANGSDGTDKNSALFSGTMENTKDEITGVCANSGTNFNFTLFDNFNYTVYVPNNDSVKALIDGGILPTWTDFKKYKDIRDSRSGYTQDEKDEASVYCDVIKTRINSFIRYHVHDNSLIIGGETGVMDYETMMLNEENRRFYTVTTRVEPTAMSVTDVTGKTRNVLTDVPALYNNICRDYWFSGGAGSTANPTRRILMDSDATVHLIDGVLRYKSDAELGSWLDECALAWEEFKANKEKEEEEGGEQ